MYKLKMVECYEDDEQGSVEAFLLHATGPLPRETQQITVGASRFVVLSVEQVYGDTGEFDHAIVRLEDSE